MVIYLFVKRACVLIFHLCYLNIGDNWCARLNGSAFRNVFCAVGLSGSWASCLIPTTFGIRNEHVYLHKAAQKKNSTKSNIQPSLHIHQISGTPDLQLNTAAIPLPLIFMPKLTHPAARFVCESWPTCFCVDIDECVRYDGQVCSQSANCHNTPGSFRCVCRQGFEPVAGSQTACRGSSHRYVMSRIRMWQICFRIVHEFLYEL